MHALSMEQVKKYILFLKCLFSNKVMWSSKCFKSHKISFRMHLNLCNAKFSRIDLENRVYGKVLLNLHFSIAFFDAAKIT